MAALRRLAGLQRWLRLARPPARGVSSGEKARSAASAQAPPAPVPSYLAPRAPHDDDEEGIPVFAKNPDYHGFDDDPVIDLWSMRLAFFFGISVLIVLGATFYAICQIRGCEIGLVGKLNEK